MRVLLGLGLLLIGALVFFNRPQVPRTQ
jgi:hypothetical protein